MTNLMKWPRTSLVLRMIELEDDARRKGCPTVRWAYGEALDRMERSIMGQPGGLPLEGKAA